MLDIIRNSWGWTGLEPAEVVSSNPFGNLIVRAVDGAYWRICPEEWSCVKIAQSAIELTTQLAADKFRIDWEMSRLVELAGERQGPLSDGMCYCLKIPAVLGGSYEAENLGTITLNELIEFSGSMAEQIKDLPDGSQIKIEITPE
jgi:hypothetical protein